ncbi:MAG: hypothetical protein ACJAS1_004982 [Oleiphilaceae bacterium]|jgi:hypothetical protein
MCLHIDGNAGNKEISNLRWGSHEENMADLTKHGTQRGNKNASAKIDEHIAVTLYVLSQLGLVGPKIYDVLHISSAQVSAIKARRAWSHVSTNDVSKLAELAKEFLDHKASKELDKEVQALRRSHSDELKNVKNVVRRRICNLLDEL